MTDCFNANKDEEYSAAVLLFKEYAAIGNNILATGSAYFFG